MWRNTSTKNVVLLLKKDVRTMRARGEESGLSQRLGLGGFDVDYYRLVNDMKTTLR